MKTAAVIIAGGRSSRMGREKAFELVGRETILARTVGRLLPQALQLAINANGEAARFRETGLMVLPDLRGDEATPLAGLHTALSFAAREGFDAVLTVPSDCPFLPPDLVERLAARRLPAAVAASGGQPHFVTGLWASALLPQLAAFLGQPRPRRLQDWARESGAAAVAWPVEPYDPFFNVNTPEDLAEANRVAAQSGA